ncbi:MAG: HAD-IIIA family hydrolase [Candidatus Kapabacteria bacterium]|nr:HAD-IIIA family hydrolase [Ignavibacteriota bacterium]MCW5884526.1 HAD-IIIA family hydrolase [Candidatus Kapabacteria bacterium]
MVKDALISQKLSKIKLLAMDVDGTLTDSAMYYSQNGEELKRFTTRDGMGITLLHKAGIKTAIITSENSAIVSARAKKLSIGHVILGSKDKSSAIRQISADTQISLDEIAFIGDDVNDEHIMKLVGVSACPSDAVEVILKTADIICSKKGGYGAVREFSEMILRAQDKPIYIQEQW